MVVQSQSDQEDNVPDVREAISVLEESPHSIVSSLMVMPDLELIHSLKQNTLLFSVVSVSEDL